MSMRQSKKAVVKPQPKSKHKSVRKYTRWNLFPGGRSETEKTKKAQKIKRRAEKRINKKPRRRIFPIWLRIIVVLILSALALIVGLMVGYGILGDGSPRDALKPETWQHIIDIVTKKE